MKSQRDGRRRTAEQQEVIRQQAVRAVLSGMKQVEAARVFGVTKTAVSLWVKKAKGKGIKSLKAKKRGGRKPGLLKGWQASWVVRTIRDKHPDQLKLNLVLWTREAVRKLIEQRFGVKMAIRTVGDYLHRWDMTPQKPVSKAYQQNPEAVKRWLEEEYPEIQKKARQEKAILFWGDEMGLRSDHVVGKSFSLKGKKPVLLKTGDRFSCNMISAVSNVGKLYFSVFQGSFVIPVYLGFLKRLIHQNKGRKVILIVDGHPVHKAIAVKEWLREHADEIEVYLLPGYSPELNPDELLNQDLKANVFKEKRPRSKNDLKALLKAKLYEIQKQPEKIQSYFKGRHVLYAAA
jgi:transposase